MRIQVLFSETSVLVPCGDGQLSVRELVDKAIIRFKKVLNKHPEDIIEVQSVRLADSGSYVAFDDEVADVLEDKEVVELEYVFLPHYIRGSDDDDDDDTLPTNTPINSTSQAYSGSNLSDDDRTPFPPDLHSSLLPSTLASIGEDFGAGQITNDHHLSSQELHHHLEELDDDVVGGVSMATSLHVMGVTGASQDLDMVNHQPWHSQNSGSQSQDPSSPHLGRKQEWPTSTDTGYATNKSQESFSQSQPKSQETFHGSVGTTAATDSLSYASHASNSEGAGNGRGGGGGGGGVPAVISASYHPGLKTSGDHTSSTHNSTSSASMLSTSMGREQHHFIGSRREDHVKGSRKTPPSSVYDHSSSFSPQSHDGYSPGQPHPLYPLPGVPGGMDHSPMGRGYDPYTGWNYAGYHVPPEGGAYDKPRLIEQFKRRSVSVYGSEHNPYHKMGGHYGTPPQGPPTMGGPMGSHPVGGRPTYSDYYGDYRGGQGRYNHPHDPHFLPPSAPSRMSHSYSHERVDVGGASMRPRPPMIGRPGMEEEFSNSPMDMFLSQPTTNYFNYERFGGPGFGHPMMGGGASG